MKNLTPLVTALPHQNQVLAALPEAVWRGWGLQLELAMLEPAQVLSEAGGASAYAYFPVTAIVSLLYLTEDGDSAEFAVVGNDGMVGISLVMGGNAMPSQAVVQSGGTAWRLAASALRQSVQLSLGALAPLLRYTQALMAQVSQTALCNRYHSIDQQLSRRLLQGLDRSSGHELLLTQEGAAQLLGVRREGITVAAHRLQRAGVIRYRRGHIDVLDRPGLEAFTCECYAADKKAYARCAPARTHLLPRAQPLEAMPLAA